MEVEALEKGDQGSWGENEGITLRDEWQQILLVAFIN